MAELDTPDELDALMVDDEQDDQNQSRVVGRRWQQKT
jgi:hypothetical protein